MKRFHIHLAVEDLAKNIAFYSALFQSPPTVQHADYAKWMLDDPRINFAISNRGAAAGLDHLGFQVESAEALEGLHQQYKAADASSVVAEAGTACCYAESDKYWLTDPQGIAWEAFHTLATIPTFNRGAEAKTGEAPEASAACCAPASATAPAATVSVKIPVKSKVANSCGPGSSCC